MSSGQCSANQIGQARLPLSFGLADAVQTISGRYPNEVPNSAINVAHTLASKVLHTPLFMAMDWLSTEFQPAKVFHLASRILEGKASLPSMTVAQATTDILAPEDPEKVAKRRAKFAAETLRLLTHIPQMTRHRPRLMTYQYPREQLICLMLRLDLLASAAAFDSASCVW